MLAAFLSTFLKVTAVLLVVSVPVFLLAKKRADTKISRKFLIGASAVGLFCAVAAAGAYRQISNCEAAGNHSCFDSGGAGIQMLAIVGFVVVAGIKTMGLYRDY